MRADEKLQTAKDTVLWTLKRWQKIMTPEELTQAIFEAPAVRAVLSSDVAPRVHTLEERRKMSDAKRYELYPEDFCDGGW